MTIMRIITLTKQPQNIVGSDVPPNGGAGAPAMFLVSRSALAAAIHQSIEVCFADPRISGPAPLETTVFHLIDEVAARVFGRR